MFKHFIVIVECTINIFTLHLYNYTYILIYKRIYWLVDKPMTQKVVRFHIRIGYHWFYLCLEWTKKNYWLLIINGEYWLLITGSCFVICMMKTCITVFWLWLSCFSTIALKLVIEITYVSITSRKLALT